MDGIAESDPVLLGSGLCAPRSWRRVKIRMWSKFSPAALPHSPPPGRADWGCPLHVPRPMGALDLVPHLPYAAVAAACRVQGLDAARPGGGGLESKTLHAFSRTSVHTGQDMASPQAQSTT